MQYAQPKLPTPQPNPSAAQVPPAKLDHTETAKIRQAMHAVTKVYPGAAGKLLAQILLDYSEWGYRISQSALPAELVRDILAQLPEQR